MEIIWEDCVRFYLGASKISPRRPPPPRRLYSARVSEVKETFFFHFRGVTSEMVIAELKRDCEKDVFVEGIGVHFESSCTESS